MWTFGAWGEGANAPRAPPLVTGLPRHDFFVACERKRISGRRLSSPGRREATTGDTSAFAGYKKPATLTGNNLRDPSLQPNFIP